MRYFFSCFFLWTFLTIALLANGLPQIPQRWNAYWIGCPDAPARDYNVVSYRKTFELDSMPEVFIIHVTADNRYRLYVNGEYVGFGPQQSDIRHWRYETYDIAPLLVAGKNVIAAEVINYGDVRPYGIITHRTGFLLQGHTEHEHIVNSEDRSWKSYYNRSYHPRLVNWMYAVDISGGFYASSPGDSLVAANYPWGWQASGFDDVGWEKAVWLQSADFQRGSFGWILEPRNVPVQRREKTGIGRIVRSDHIDVSQAFADADQPLTIPAHTSGSFLIDFGEITLGYPELVISGGKDAIIGLQYGESLYNPDRTKGHRDQIDGKIMIGIRDVLVADGGSDRALKPFWHRAFRYVRVNIQTFDEPLVIEKLSHEKSEAPIPFVARFESDNPLYGQVMDICLRTLRIATQDLFISDVYYETMQYVGDSRPHGLAWMALTGDDRHFRNALTQFHHSRLPDGNLTSCYPLKATFVHPTYSLIWIDMIHDYMMYRGDKLFIRPFLSDIDGVLDFFERHLNENGIPGHTNWPYFVDWYNHENTGGTSPVSRNGNSGVITLHYLYSLRNAADIHEWFGNNNKATDYRLRANKLTEIVNHLFYDTEKGSYAENPEKTFFDQRTNIMAVLTDVIEKDKQAELLKTVLNDSAFSRAGMYYRYNLFNALHKANAGELLDQSLEMWYDCINMGLTTTPESGIDEDPRSEAHPWAASPAWAFFHVVCGIVPTSPAFEDAVIQPSPGNLSYIKASYPHPAGELVIDLNFENNAVKGRVVVPDGPKTSFLWKGKKLLLLPGENTIEL